MRFGCIDGVCVWEFFNNFNILRVILFTILNNFSEFEIFDVEYVCLFAKIRLWRTCL